MDVLQRYKIIQANTIESFNRRIEFFLQKYDPEHIERKKYTNTEYERMLKDYKIIKNASKETLMNLFNQR